MNEKYSKLISPLEYLNDEPVGFAAVKVEFLPGPIEEKFWVYISERLWSRLIFIGNAYNLHFPQIVEPVIDTVLLPEQCDSFDEELAFLLTITNDSAFSEALHTIRAEIGKVINRKSMRFVISPP